MLSRIPRFVKAIASFVGAVLGLWSIIAADKNISFEEIGYAQSVIVGAIAAFLTAISPANKSEA